MNKNIQNFLMFSQKALTTKEVSTNIFATGIFLWMEAVIGFQRFVISIWGMAYLIVILFAGIIISRKQNNVNIHLYRGVVYTGYSIICFMTSYDGLRLNRTANGMVLAAYILVYLLCFVTTFYMVKRLIKKDAYNKKAQPVSTGSVFIGVILSMSLCPVIFSGYDNNQAGAAIAFLFLLLGSMCLFGSINLYKAVLFKKYEKEILS